MRRNPTHAASAVRRGSLLALVVALLIPSAGFAQSREAYLKSNARILDVFGEVVAKPSESTVRVLCDGKECALGTIVSADGYILTKYSQLEGTQPVVRLKNDKEYKALIVGYHKGYDLALLRIDEKGLKPIEWRKDNPAPGDWLATPGACDKALCIGVVSVAPRKTSPRDFPVSLTPPAGSGYLGVLLDQAEERVIIKEVTKDSAAQKAGVENDDVVLAVNGKAIKDVPGMIAQVSGKKAGEVITLKLLRGDEEKEIKVTLGKRPVSPMNRGDFQNHLGSELSKLRSGFPIVLQHDTVVKPNDCGGPVVDLNGKAVGINIARAGRVESYAVPADVVLSLLPDLKSGKLPPPKD